MGVLVSSHSKPYLDMSLISYTNQIIRNTMAAFDEEACYLLRGGRG